MKLVFVICMAVMTALSVVAALTLPTSQSSVPMLYWATDANPARGPQMAAFERWMVDNGHGRVKVAVDSNNTGEMKVIIQSASGVGAQIIDIYGGRQLQKYVAAGVIRDVTDMAASYGFGLDKTYAAARSEVAVDGRQYAFPCNVTGWPLTINRGLLEREGLPMPKYDWTWDEFLQWCLAVTKVDDQGRTVRFAIMPGPPTDLVGFKADKLWATNGGSIFNETMTRCVLDSPAVLEASRFYYDLMFKYHVIPTPVDSSAQPSSGGWGSAAPRWVGNETAVGLVVGRWGLIQLRQYAGFTPTVALYPRRVMTAQPVQARASAINACADDPELVGRFLQFLASDEYSRLIIHDDDALPPNPGSATDPAFLRPEAHRDEWGVHEQYYRAVADHGVGVEYSPFISPFVVTRLIAHYLSGISSGAIELEPAHREMTDQINLELSRAVQRDPRLQARYQDALARQAEIDALKADGRLVPPALIDNPVLRRLREVTQ